jgi:hypothetical protein
VVAGAAGLALLYADPRVDIAGLLLVAAALGAHIVRVNGRKAGAERDDLSD